MTSGGFRQKPKISSTRVEWPSAYHPSPPPELAAFTHASPGVGKVLVIPTRRPRATAETPFELLLTRIAFSSKLFKGYDASILARPAGSASGARRWGDGQPKLSICSGVIVLGR